MISFVATVVIGVGVVGAHSPARADVVAYTSQARSISAYAIDHINNINDSHSAGASDFGPFNSSVSASAGIGQGSASMNSMLSTATGISVSAGVTGIGSINQNCEGGGSASYTIGFTLSQAADAMLSYSTLDGGFALNGPGVSIFAGSFDSAGPFALVLPAGSYTFSGGCSLSNHSSGTGTYSQATLVVPGVGAGAVVMVGIGVGCVGRRRR
jgi:hypothetical protein